MARFVVLDPPADMRNGDVMLVRDRFHWLALIFPLFWLLYHRLWLASLAYLAAAAALGGLARLSGSGTLQLSLLLLGILVALEGPAWRIAKLRRAGYAETGTLQADRLDDAERMLAENVPAAGKRHGPAPIPLTSAPADRAWRSTRSLLDPIGK